MRNSHRNWRRVGFEQLEDRRLLANSPILAGAHLIYNNSAFDGNDPAAAVSDDAAIATDKSWLLPGQAATFANYSSFDKGINALAIDVRNLGPSPTVDAFDFKVGTSADPSTWADAPAPTGFSVRSGAGAGGADRLTVVWADGAIKNTWLQVTLVATGNCFTSATPSARRAIARPTRSCRRPTRSPSALTRAARRTAGIDSAYDFNRDGKVDAADELIARSNRRLLSEFAAADHGTRRHRA